MSGKNKIGLIVNPLAGLGGRVGLKGSDGEETCRRALALGAVPVSPERTRQALAGLQEIRDDIELLSYPKEMGEEEAAALGFSPTVIGSIVTGATTPQDTIEAARAMRARGVGLLLFTGGDGTARNICDAVSDTLPALGIPAGVKIHSGVYAANPVKAARLAVDFVRSPGKIALQRAEVMDIDEELVRQDRVSARLYGYLRVPHERGLNQSAKAGSSPGEEAAQEEIASDVINGMEPGAVYLIAPGTTTKAITEALGLQGTVLGIDALQARRLLGADLNEEQILQLMGERPHNPFWIVVTVIGRQGFLFGRGNQQLSPAVIRRVGRPRILVVATIDKILSLRGQPILVDTGDVALDAELAGYVSVVTGFGRRQVYPVSA